MNYRFLLAIGALVLTFGACGSRPSFPGGTFVAGQSTSAGVTGTELRFSGDGTYSLNSPNNLPMQGTYAVTGDQIVFTLSEGTAEGGQCVGIPGTYKWSFEGNALKFTPVSDACGVRRISWPSASWIRQP